MKLALSLGTTNKTRGDLSMEAMVQTTVKKGFLRNEKGLTLIELLAVIVILAIVAAIAIPSIGGVINKTKKESHRSNAHLIIDAARFKVSSEGFIADSTTTPNTQTIGLYTLNAEGYLEKVPKDPQGTGNTTYTIGTATAPNDSSFVTATRTAATGKVTFAITLTGSGTTYLGGTTPVSEELIDTATINQP